MTYPRFARPVFLNQHTGPMPIADRFWAHVEKGDGCWLWRGAMRTTGYGSFFAEGHLLQAHRVAFELANGPIAPGMHVCHRCDVKACVRPDHLFLGTRSDNMRDALRKGRSLSGDAHPFARMTADQVAELRARASAGEACADLARAFGISYAHSWDLIRGRRRRDEPR
jgi:hypothetical protein